MLTSLSLFAGIGGFDLAAKRCGIESITAAEIDPQAFSPTQDVAVGTAVGTNWRSVTKRVGWFQPASDAS